MNRSTPQRRLLVYLLLFCAPAIADKSSTNPASTAAEPIVAIIASVNPEKALPGTTVTIFLDFPQNDFAPSRNDLRVSFDGTEAKLLHVSQTLKALRVVVPPDLPEGQPGITVQSDPGRNGEYGFSAETYDAFTTARSDKNPEFKPEANTDSQPDLKQKTDDARPDPSFVSRYKDWISRGIAIAAMAFVLISAIRSRRQSRRREEEFKHRIDELNYQQHTKTGSADASPDEAPEQAETPLQGNVPDLPEELAEACRNGEVVLFVGAGVGSAVGFPTRRQLMQRVLDKVETEDERDWSEVGKSIRSDELTVAEDLLSSRLTRSRFVELVRLAVQGPEEIEIPETLAELRTIAFRGVVSSTWDELIEHAFATRNPRKLNPQMGADFAELLRANVFFLLRAYGEASDPENLILNGHEYRKAVYGNRAYARFVGSLFTTGSLFFVGASLETIEDFLTNSEIRDKSERGHFALVPRSEATTGQQERMKSRYNLTLMIFDPTPGFPEVAEFCKTLTEAAPGRPTAEPTRTLEPETLHRITLENIGPFETLDLSLNPGWNVLLGNNGCGKSTVLRAIALALCGDDGTTDAAQGLLRSETNQGVIKLFVGKDTYSTVLRSDGHRVQVDPKTVTPVQGGGWLALGFPPMRGASGPPIRGLANIASPNPVVDDLLPLVNGSIDNRFNDLRQWLVTLCVLADGRGVDAKRSAQLRDAFFRVMQKLTPGTEFSYKSYTKDPFDVLLDTTDGPLPIGRMSQGMSSVFSWVGTVLRRLYEVYDEEPEQQGCLVLIDEIGAHLHPEWQGEIVGLLRDVFPNLQVVATTHSPLVVANANKGEVFHCRRIDGMLKIDAIQHSFKGWRADQILTAAPFGLSYARDRETRDKLLEYKKLINEPERGSQGDLRLQQLSEELDELVPSYHELEETREASGLMMEWIKERISDAPEERRSKVLQEAELYLTKIRKGD